MSKNSFYFQHDYAARNDQKILMLRAEYGWEGYGIYWAVLESMAENNGYLDREFIGGLSVGYGLAKDRLMAIIDYCVSVQLLQSKDNKIYSPRLLKHIELREFLSDSGKEGALKRWNSGGGNGGGNRVGNGNPNAKERKGKERKERKRKKEFTPPLIEDVVSYFISKGYSEISARKAFDYYQTANWKDSTGKQVLNWKQKMISVWFKTENEIKQEKHTPLGFDAN